MKLLKTLVVGMLILSVSACDNFFDVNTDPDAATAVPGGLLFPTMLASWGSNRAMEGGQYTNYFSQTFSSNAVLGNWYDAERYAISATAVNNHWLAYYGTVQRNAALGIAAAFDATPQRPNEAAQFMILSALNYYESTLLWEDVPFSEANQPVEFPEPNYDTQQQVFNGVIAKLNEALALIDVATPGTAVGTRDVVYGSNMQNWIAFANAVKLHVYMSLRGGGQNVNSEIQALINLPDTDIIRVASRNAYIPFSASSKNPLGRMQEVYPGSVNWFWSGKPITDIMVATNDPRLPIYMMPATSDGAFRNAPAASGLGQTNASRTRINTYLANTMPVVLAYAHETLFLEAEWLAQNGQLGAADAKFREGIRQAFASLTTPVPGNAGAVGRAPGATAISAAARDAFIAQFPALSTLSAAAAVKLIWEQHYVGLHGDGIQSWTLVRRVGEPQLGLNYPAVGALGGLTSWLSRWPYQVNEMAANPNSPDENPPLDRNMWFQGSAQQ